MTNREPRFSITVDVTNPGQFFACCGILELAHRLWPGAEGAFDSSTGHFAIYSEDAAATLETVISKSRACQILGLSEEEQQERNALEGEKRALKKQERKLSKEKEARRTELGELSRKGAIRFGPPFNLLLNWWQTEEDDPSAPKTWAGRQELHKVARAAQDAFSGIGEPTEMCEFRCVMRLPREYCKGESDSKKPVEPFYFDARRFAHALDAGFSLDVQDAETTAHPAVELLSLIGLQRFRPAPGSERWTFNYWLWPKPLTAGVAAAVASGAVPLSGSRGYRYRLLFRDDQKRYKAFSFATPVGDNT